MDARVVSREINYHESIINDITSDLAQIAKWRKRGERIIANIDYVRALEAVSSVVVKRALRDALRVWR